MGTISKFVIIVEPVVVSPDILSKNESVKDKDQFWSKVSERIDWYKPWETVKKYDFHKGKIEWFLKGKLNASYNCIDRHVENGFGDSLAIIWEGNDPNQSRKFTYSELLKEVSLFANALKQDSIMW